MKYRSAFNPIGRLSVGSLVALVLIAHHSFAQYSSADLSALRALPVTWEQCWNSHDMDRMGTLLRNDVDFVNVAGIWLKGKAAVVKDHKQKHQGVVFKPSNWTTDSVAIRYIKSDLAILHIGWGVTGDNDPDGTPRTPRHGIFTWVASKDNGQWQLLAVHNVNSR